VCRPVTPLDHAHGGTDLLLDDDGRARAAPNAEVAKQATIVAYADDFKLMMIVAR
jgi:hypothetical protein